MQRRTTASLPLLTLAMAAWASAAALGQSTAAPSTPPPSAPSAAPSAQSAPVEPAPNANPFPLPDPRNFNTNTPTKETVDEFLRSSWGYDPNRIWQVEAILRSSVPGVSRVVVSVAEKGGPKEQTGQLSFFTLPDGKHIISDAVLPFGAKPFDDLRHTLQQRANGPFKGAHSKDFELVEFADFECPHCKEAEPTIAKLLADYPSAHFVFQDFPLVQIHSEAFKAASYGTCVAQAGGNDAFFKFQQAVFDNQTGLTPQSSDQTLKDAAAKAGQDPAKISACAASSAMHDRVQASIDLAQDLGVSSTPMLFVNGRGLPLSAVSYPTLQKIINFQVAQDGLNVPAPPPAAEAPAPSLK